MSANAVRGLRILVTGRDGQVGGELLHSLASLGEVTATSRAELDLASETSIQDAIRRARPQLIVNAAAYTAVDKAESEPDLAQRVNVSAVVTLAAEAKTVGAAMIHYSTDYVFDGSKTTPYVEADATNPLSVYGRTKLAGELALASAGIPYLILRTSWVYGAQGKNFLRTILKLAAEKPELRIVDDQIGAPTCAHDIAQATAAIVRNWMTKDRDARSGIYHLTATGETSWYGFAAEAVRLRAMSEPRKTFARLAPISTAEYPTPAARPKNSRLECGKLRNVFGVQLPDWKNSLANVVPSIH
ncbi:MAG TPA: dTDP-4-dehydrorhamnose reductase [Acidobacteriaceae bacterium]|nr:dTDP-4-dehydrorhamnose reductase [Acidobacteriaceae bacterium]